MITQYACNKPASRPLNIRLNVAKTRFTQSNFRMLHALSSPSNLHAIEKRRKTFVTADSEGHVSQYHNLAYESCLACQLFFLTRYYFIIYAK